MNPRKGGKINRSSGMTHAELLARAVAALVREWGVSEEDARAALMRNHAETLRLGNELAAVWREERSEAAAKPPPQPPDVIDLTAPGPEWTVYLDHGKPVLGRVEYARAE